jgi:hypothetical protein
MTRNTDITREQRVCQLAAEALWTAATSDDPGISGSWNASYKALERAFVLSVRAVYGLSALKANRVRDLLAELGPDDGAVGTSGWGVASYVEYVKTNRESSAYTR